MTSKALWILTHFSQGYGFSSGHVWMWELDCEESWVTKNWCFWTVVLEKTLESPLDCREVQPVHPKEDQSWVLIGRTNAKADTQGDNRGWDGWWHHWLDGCESGWTPGAGDGQGGLVCCDSWGCKELNTTKWLNWTWPPHGKSWLTGKDPDAGRDWGQEEKGTTEDEMAGWHHWLDGHEFEWTLGVGDGQGGLLCCDSWGCK